MRPRCSSCRPRRAARSTRRRARRRRAAAGAQSAQQAAAVYLKNLIRKQYTKAMGETAERAARWRGVLDAVLRQSGGAGGRACERALCEALHEMVTADLPHGRWDELPAELATLLQGAGGADENDAADRSASYPGALVVLGIALKPFSTFRAGHDNRAEPPLMLEALVKRALLPLCETTLPALAERVDAAEDAAAAEAPLATAHLIGKALTARDSLVPLAVAVPALGAAVGALTRLFARLTRDGVAAGAAGARRRRRSDRRRARARAHGREARGAVRARPRGAPPDAAVRVGRALQPAVDAAWAALRCPRAAATAASAATALPLSDRLVALAFEVVGAPLALPLPDKAVEGAAKVTRALRAAAATAVARELERASCPCSTWRAGTAACGTMTATSTSRDPSAGSNSTA